VSTKGGSGGNRKSSKKNQPKRQRYVGSGRMVRNAIKNLERHMKLYSKDGQDKMAEESLTRLRGTR